jgi:hypothetical protein
MHRFRLLFVLLASVASFALAEASIASASSSGSIVFDGSPGTGAPPTTLGPYTMTPFGADPQPLSTDVGGVAGPTGSVVFGASMQHLQIGNGWATWSNGYTGDVYWTDGATSASVTLPAGTTAFYLYAEPNPFSDFQITAYAQDGTSSGPITVNGFAGAQYFGFYATDGQTIASITITSSIDFAIGEFGIAAPGLKAVALPPSGVHVDDSLDATKPVGAFLDPAGTSGDASIYQATVDFGAGNGAQPAVVVPAGGACPPALSNPSGNPCFLVLPSAAAAKSPYQQAGTYQLQVSVSDTSTSRTASDTQPVTVANSTYRIDAKAWIPYPIVVDPLNPVPGFLPPSAAAALGWPTCGAPAGLFIPLPPPVPTLLTVTSNLRGDTHTGFAGSFRVETILQFDWTGSQLVNAQITPNAAISTRAITYTLFARSWSCDMTALATTATPMTGASGTSFAVSYSSATPLVPLAPTIDGLVQGSFASDGTMSLNFTTDGFPSHGVSIDRNGTTQQIDILNDASCIGQSGVLGFAGLAKTALGLTGAVTSVGSFTDTPDQTGTTGLDQTPHFPIC